MEKTLKIDILFANIGVRDNKVVQIIYQTSQYQPVKSQSFEIKYKQKNVLTNLKTQRTLIKHAFKNEMKTRNNRKYLNTPNFRPNLLENHLNIEILQLHS